MIRLVNVDTLQLVEFTDLDIPPYAILSHRWIRGQELTLTDLNRHPSESTNLFGRKRAGALKSKGACIVARRHGLQWIWIDSCCIDKSNNTELSEAINSMYLWYKHAKVCFAYLFDVLLSDKDRIFENSTWFDRCWTLQELIAPHNVEFYDANWDLLGTKLSLRNKISDVTGIELKVLDGADINTIPIGRRMSWVSSRKSSGLVAPRTATCIEDEAYSLLGLFEVNMPLLYGEKRNAFKRLQEAILETVDDPSIFAWDSSSMAECHEKLNKFRSLQNWSQEKRNLLATEPGRFRTPASWLSRDTSETDHMSFITICDMFPNALAVCKAIFEEYTSLIANSVTHSMMISNYASPQTQMMALLADQLQTLARHLDSVPKAQEYPYANCINFLQSHATLMAKNTVLLALEPNYAGLSPEDVVLLQNFTHVESHGSDSRQTEMDFSFVRPTEFVASSRPFSEFAQVLVDSLHSTLHYRFRKLLERQLEGEKNKHNRAKHLLQLIDLEFDQPTDLPEIDKSQSISAGDRLRRTYELLFGSRKAPAQSLQPGQIHISWESAVWGLPKTIAVPKELQDEFIKFSGEAIDRLRKQSLKSRLQRQQPEPDYDQPRFMFLAVPMGMGYHIVRLSTRDMTEKDILAQIRDSYARTRGLLRLWCSLWNVFDLKLAFQRTLESSRESTIIISIYSFYAAEKTYRPHTTFET
ncbi:hypothetical protein G7054_g10074 [Neopestalotiopsis clavispora]|nr:hypothetical protein G7054_g10074 [Neopestalotiopsis clavispora]